MMTATPRPLVAGNWKMNGLRAEGVALARAIAEGWRDREDAACEVLLCPPATLLQAVADAIVGSRLALGAQDCHAEPEGAHTGDVSAEMLADLGCRYVIVGHSERRAGHGETNAQVRRKAEAARRAGLAAIVCLGESEAERDAGATLAVIERQFSESLPLPAPVGAIVLAYEPVWAIGSGRTPAPAEVAEVHGRLRSMLIDRHGDEGRRTRILYGGSVKPDNAPRLLGLADVDGALVGGASLKAADFLAIARAKAGFRTSPTCD